MQEGTKLRRSPHKKMSRESGHVLIFTAACMTVLIGFAGLAADVGVLLRSKRLLQTAADAGAISGAAELHYGGVTAAALAATAQNGITDGGVSGAVVTVNNPPASGPHAGDAGYVEVITSEPEPTFFMRIFSRNSAKVAARAVAGTRGSRGCIYTLGTPTGHGPAQGLTLNGGANISVPGCPIIDNGDLTKNGMAGTIIAGAVGVAGDATYHEGTITPTPVTGMAPAGDPLGYLPAPTPADCTATYTTDLTIKDPTDFAPGMYCLDGGLTVQGGATMTGTDVTFYVKGNIKIDGNATVNLTAPSSGTYNGILFFGRGIVDVDMGGTTGSVLTGIIYFPNANMTLHGTDGMTLNTTLITKTLTVEGNIVLNDYAMYNGGSPLGAPRLVE